MPPNQQDPDNANAPGLSGSDEVSVWEAIQTFETILEVFPEDVSALESLAVAYEQAGDAAKGREKYLALARIWAGQSEWRRVREITKHLLELQPEDAEARELHEQAVAVLGEEGEDEATAAAETGAALAGRVGRKLEVDLRGELELAWFLLQNSIINQDQYEKAIESLTENRMNPGSNASLSLLQELQVLEWIDMETIVDFLAAETTVPFIELRNFELDPEIAAAIPLDECRRTGVLPFEKMESEYMVALMNPVDLELQKKITDYLGTPVHFYFTSPESFQSAVSALEKQQK
ncbi:MAG: hypothetical protein GXP31_01790 [Kiritimatiellaeota bacterium]|nr:hypothetical protein [Kiritimatiellota bacterium]